jgi:hypothetical protein
MLGREEKIDCHACGKSPVHAASELQVVFANGNPCLFSRFPDGCGCGRFIGLHVAGDHGIRTILLSRLVTPKQENLVASE